MLTHSSHDSSRGLSATMIVTSKDTFEDAVQKVRALSISMLLQGAIDGGYIGLGTKVLVPRREDIGVSEEIYNECIMRIAVVGCVRG